VAKNKRLSIKKCGFGFFYMSPPFGSNGLAAMVWQQWFGSNGLAAMVWQQWFGSNGSELLAALFKTKKPQCRVLGLLCCSVYPISLLGNYL